MSRIQAAVVRDVDTNRSKDTRKPVGSYYARRVGGGSAVGCRKSYGNLGAFPPKAGGGAVVIATPDPRHAFIDIAAAAEAGTKSGGRFCDPV